VVPLTNLTVTQLGHIIPYNATLKFITINQIDPGSQVTLNYDPSNSSSYFSFDLPADFSASTFQEIFKIEDTHNNFWFNTLSFPVQPLVYPYVNGITRHVSGNASGAFAVTVVEAQKTTSHTYFISWVDSINANGDAGYSVMDSTTTQMLLVNHSLPDEYGHTSPEIDGFKVLFGWIDTLRGLQDWNVTGTRHWTWANGDSLNLSTFMGAIGTAYDEWFSSSTISLKDLHDIEFDFAITDTSGNIINPNDTNASFAYRYLRNSSAPPAQPSFAPFIVHSGRGFAYQDYNKSMPLAAYEVIGTQKRRLMVGFLENNASKGLVDGKYWPPYYGSLNSVTNTDTAGPMEWFFVFDKDYSTIPDPAFEADISSTTVPMMVFGTPARRDRGAWSQPWSFTLMTHRHPTNQDVWAFTPSKDVVLPPVSISVFQNYPNPFNSSTTIQYKIPMRGKITVIIYDLLGREVRTLVNTEQPGGVYKAGWNMETDEHIQVSSGVYFYRIAFAGDDRAHTSFVTVKKMLVLK
ncbi:MAG: T9SS type A sorting domain-containing protein, partial [Bacteroidota bacterium]|nr:T9SS type A sorting domain-containing protein [Bacteroidota bacterium]